MTYLHQVSYLRLRDELGVCLSYCCLSGTTCMCACRSPIYCCLSGITCILAIFQNIATLLLLLCTWYTVSQLCVSRFCDHHRACISDEQSAWMLSVLEIEQNLFLRNTYTKYHICLMSVFILFLSIRYNVCIIIQYNITTSSLLLSTSHNVYTCHSPKYHYIIVTVVYLVYCCCLLYTSPSPRDKRQSRMPSSA